MTSEMLIGIDVAKDELVIDSGQGLVSIANTAEAIDAWLKTLPTVSYWSGSDRRLPSTLGRPHGIPRQDRLCAQSPRHASLCARLGSTG